MIGALREIDHQEKRRTKGWLSHARLTPDLTIDEGRGLPLAARDMSFSGGERMAEGKSLEKPPNSLFLAHHLRNWLPSGLSRDKGCKLHTEEKAMEESYHFSTGYFDYLTGKPSVPPSSRWLVRPCSHCSPLSALSLGRPLRCSREYPLFPLFPSASSLTRYANDGREERMAGVLHHEKSAFGVFDQAACCQGCLSLCHYSSVGQAPSSTLVFHLPDCAQFNVT